MKFLRPISTQNFSFSMLSTYKIYATDWEIRFYRFDVRNSWYFATYEINAINKNILFYWCDAWRFTWTIKLTRPMRTLYFIDAMDATDKIHTTFEMECNRWGKMILVVIYYFENLYLTIPDEIENLYSQFSMWSSRILDLFFLFPISVN